MNTPPTPSRRSALFASLALILPGSLALPAQQPVGQPGRLPSKTPLRVTYLGDPDTDRGRAFAEFLNANFERADIVARDTFDPSAELETDVVLLDWPQGPDARKARASARTPLGDRASWCRPTVLLGSAGLNVAVAWNTRGTFG